MQLVAIPSTQSESNQFLIADYVIHSFLDFQPQLWGLPPFQDWVKEALPFESVHVRGLYKNGSLHEIPDIGASYLCVQVWGMFFGWVDVDSLKRFKIILASDGTVVVALSGETLENVVNTLQDWTENWNRKRVVQILEQGSKSWPLRFWRVNHG